MNLKIVLFADWNLVLDYNKDTRGYRGQNNPKARAKVVELMEELELIDPWRIKYPNSRRCTWSSDSKPKKHARLDFFLVSQDLHALTDKIEILNKYRSDHCLTKLTLNFYNNTRGKGFWKFNNSLLYDGHYVNMVKRTISDVIEQYKSPLDRNNTEGQNSMLDDQLLMEMIKLEIRGRSIAFSCKKQREVRNKEHELEDKILELEKANENNSNEIVERELKKHNIELQQLRQEKIKGIMLRSKATWVEMGEKPTKYFCSLEKKNYVNKLITKLNINGKEIRDPKLILAEEQKFYENLYSSKGNSLWEIQENTHFFLQSENIVPIDNDDKEMCDNLISEFEIKTVLKNMKNNKSPGSDGFSADFYKVFWKDLGPYVTKSLNYGLQHNLLSVTQRQGIITCLPKGNKPREFLKNWRPISLLNTEYKLLTGVLAARLKKCLPDIISQDQKGFLKGRFIGENTRLVYDTMDYLKRKSKCGLLLLIDFEKAFDSVEWHFIKNVLKVYNFGEEFIRWYSILYNQAESCVINNGHASKFFKLGRGCRQGDPISPYIFVLVIEPLAMSIKHNPKVKGIIIEQRQYLIGQYADDTFLLLDGNEDSLKAALETFKKFFRCSGLKINLDKTQAIWLGNMAGSEKKLCQDVKLKWDTEFVLLGIRYSTLENNILQFNIESKLATIRNTLTVYAKRTLSLHGKVTVIKTLVIPKLIHVLSIIPYGMGTFIGDFQRLIREFIWNGKRAKVSDIQLAQTTSKGGLNLTHLPTLVIALRITWIKRILETSGTWQDLAKTILGNHNINMIIHLDKLSLEKIIAKVDNPFWKEVLKARISFCQDEGVNDILACPIWNTWFIQKCNIIGKRKQLTQRGCCFLRDLLTDAGKFLTYHEFKTKFDVNINILDYHGLMHSIPNEWRNKLNDTIYEKGRTEETNFDKIIKGTGVNKKAYLKLINNSRYIDAKFTKWELLLNTRIPNEEREQICEMPYMVTMDSKSRTLHYKIINKILVTNKYLHMCKIKDSNLCTFCNLHEETIEHVLWACPQVNDLWHNLEICLWPYINIAPVLNQKNILLGIYNYENCTLLNLICLIVKRYIYAQKCKEESVTVMGAVNAIKICHIIEEEIIKGKGQKAQIKHLSKWERLNGILR
jgi:hypothetical protein